MLYRLAVSLTRQQKRLTVIAMDVVLIAVAHVISTSLLLGRHKIKLNAYQIQGILDSVFAAAVLTVAGVFYASLATRQHSPRCSMS